jgi:hypothetical protein
MIRYVLPLLVLGLWIYAFIDCLQTPENEVRGLPKLVWVLIILFFGEVLVGPVAWLVAGRSRGALAEGGGTPSQWHRNRRGAQFVAPDDNPEFLRSLQDENKDGKKKDEGEAQA